MKSPRHVCKHCPLPLRGTKADRNYHMSKHHPEIHQLQENLNINGHAGTRSANQRIFLANLIKGTRMRDGN